MLQKIKNHTTEFIYDKAGTADPLPVILIVAVTCLVAVLIKVLI